MVYFCVDKALCKHQKVIGSHIKNITEAKLRIFFHKPGKIMEFCQFGKVGTPQDHLEENIDVSKGKKSI